jgi:hypothetical protein
MGISTNDTVATDPSPRGKFATTGIPPVFGGFRGSDGRACCPATASKLRQ